MAITIKREIELKEFDGWCGAENTASVILDNDMAEDFEYMIEELYPDGLTETELNDILRFESDWVYERLGIEVEE